MRLKQHLIGLCMLFMASVAAAGNADLTFTYATKNTDGTSIPATGPGSITTSTIEYGTCTGTGGFNVKQGQIAVVPPATMATVNMVVVQQYCFRATHTNTFGVTSDFSNVAVKNNPAPKPLPPGTLTVDNALIAYDFQEGDNLAQLIPVGTMKAGAACNGEKEVLGAFLVKVEDVDSWYGSVRPRTVYASCS